MRHISEPESRSHWANTAAAHIPGTLTPGSEFRRLLSSSPDLLDVGCGPRPSWTVLETDPLPRMGFDLNLAALRVARHADQRATFACASGTDLPLKDGSVGAVTLIATLTVIPELADAEKLIAETLRVVRPGGLIGIADFLYDASNSSYRDRYAEMGFSGELIARDARGEALYRARHWETDRIDRMMSGCASREHLHLRQVSSRTGNLLTGFEAVYRRA